MFGLPFKRTVALDFEYNHRWPSGLASVEENEGATPVPVCMVARELESGRLIRAWQHELAGNPPPFPVDDGTLFVAYYSLAELSCFRSLGWPQPKWVLDLCAEFKLETNGLVLPVGRELLGALSYHGIGGITKQQKTGGRDLVLRGGPWDTSERRQILNYCQTDVDCLEPLLERMLAGIRSRASTPGQALGQALLRGRATRAFAEIEHTGTPVDTDRLATLREQWKPIKADLIKLVDKDYGVYDDGHFRLWLFEDLLSRLGLLSAWPRTKTGKLDTKEKTFRDQARLHPELADLHTLRQDLSELRLERLAVGADGRNRTPLWCFGTKTGRNAPSNAKFIFGPSKWVRKLIKPQPGRAISYLDWTSQEVWIAAMLSDDTTMLATVRSNDVYIDFAVRAGLAPPDATKKSHPSERAMCKVLMLGTNYGMSAWGLAHRANISKIEADSLMRKRARLYPQFTRWAWEVADISDQGGHLSSVFGWAINTRGLNARKAVNFPIQSTGADMLRLACCLATERGVSVCCPVHDALLVEASADGIGEAVAVAKEAMTEASRVVLGGLEIPVDDHTYHWPGRYKDPEGRGESMWAKVCHLIKVDPSL